MPVFVEGRVAVTVPATSANLGPGYDSLGIALGLRDRVTVEVTGGRSDIRVRGEGEGRLPLDETHLVHRAMSRAFAAMGCEVPGVRLYCENAIPHSRGLGSSSAAIVAGVCAARGLVAGGSLLMDDDTVLDLAAQIEGHPDNVAPAFYGGFTIAFEDDRRFRAVRASVDPRVEAVVFVPPGTVETALARGLLPAAVPHADAAANAARAALLVAAMTRQPELLFEATEDLLHQDYRESAMPDSLALVRRLRSERIAAVVSGAGPSVLALTDGSDASELVGRAPKGWDVRRLAVEQRGAEVAVVADRD